MPRAALILAVATGCNQLLGTPEIDRHPCSADSPFTRPTPVGGLGELGAQTAQLSRDERTVVFSRVTVAGEPGAPVTRHGDLYMAHRDHLGEEFRDVIALDELNSDLDELGASLSEDQQTLYFDRQDASGRYQIFSVHRPAPTERFGVVTAVELGNDTSSHLEPFITSGALFFATRRSDGSASLSAAVRNETAFATPQQLVSLEILPPPAAYENPVVSSDGLTIYFSAPPDNANPQDIWAASRAALDQPFGEPHAVAELNSSSADRPAWISEDSCRLYFVTNRSAQGFQLWMALH